LLEGNLEQWTHTSLIGETIYEPIMDIDQGVIIRAESNGSASALNYSKELDLNKTPILQWQWTAEILPYALKIGEEGIEHKITVFDETKPHGNDFVLRVIVSRSSLFSDVKSLHYVWSSNQLINDKWSIDENTKVLVVSGEGQTTMKWQTIARNIQKDWAELFGEKIHAIDDITIMTDSDAIQGHAVGYYGDIQALGGKPIAGY
jgi:hypothetical protein